MDRISMITALFARALAIKSIGGDSLSYIGVTTTVLSDGATTNPITIDGDTVTATNGNVALYSGDAFVFNGTIWQASSAISQIFTEIGDLSDLDTEAKTDLVSAINEVNEEKQDDVELSLTPTAVVSDRDIIDGQGNTLSVLAEALTKTASGNPVVITDCAGGKARSLITSINAIQDLHGYDKPWVGGTGKNKLAMTVDNIKSWNGGASSWSGNSKVISGITWTIITDSADNVTGIKANGTASATSLLQISDTMSFTEGDKINGASGGSSDSYGIGASGVGMVQTDDDYTVTAAFASGDKYIYCRVNNGVAVSDKMFYPMLRNPSESATFAPYSNLCPISGRDSVVLTRSDGDEISEDFTIQLGTTVYGADINWDTGVMAVKTAVVDMGSLEWFRANTHRFQSTGLNGLIYPNSDNVIPPDMKCEIYKPFAASQTPTMAFGITAFHFTSDNTTYLRALDANIDDLTAFMAQIDGKKLEYTLATPTTIQLTPTQLEMLKGYNRVTIDNGTITLDYIAKAISGNDEEIAPLVGDKATKSYAVNDFIERADGLYRVTAPIASGASFTANNTVKMSIGEALTYLYNK